MSSRVRLTVALALSVGVPAAVAVIVAPTLLAGRDLVRATQLVLGVGAGGVILTVFVALRHDERIRRRAEASERERVEFRRAVARLGDTLAATRDLTRLAEVALHETVRTVGARRGVFFAVNPARSRIQARAGVGVDGLGELPWGAGVAGAVAAWGRPVLSPRDTQPEPPEPRDKTAAAVPLMSRGAIFGVLAVYGREDGEAFTEDALETLLTFARHTEAAIDNIYLQEEARRLSITDGLTGLWNRREFELRCRQEYDRATRFHRDFTVILLDVDRFKEINDSWGHHGGDAVLVELAGRLAAVTREIDTVARYGGDEFALLLPETGPEGAQAVARKISEAVRTTPFEVEGAQLPVTVSVGVATFSTHGVSARRIVVAADEALYQAKRGGRDRTEFAARDEAAGSTEGSVAGTEEG